MGMKINGAKCKVLSPSHDHITIDGTQVESVNEFVFLGSAVPDSTYEINRRTALASQSFGRLRKTVWDVRNLSRNLKIRLYKALIVPIAIYASETWTLKASDKHKLEVFEMRCLRSILGVNIRDRITNVAVRKGLKCETTIVQEIQKRRLRWFGHVVRKPHENFVSRAYRQDFPNPRPRDRPAKRWIDQVREDTSLPIATAERRANDRRDWRRACHVVGSKGRMRLSN